VYVCTVGAVCHNPVHLRGPACLEGSVIAQAAHLSKRMCTQNAVLLRRVSSHMYAPELSLKLLKAAQDCCLQPYLAMSTHMY